MIRQLSTTLLLSATMFHTVAHAQSDKNVSETDLFSRIKGAIADATAPSSSARHATGSTIFRDALTGRVFVTGTSSLETTPSSLQLTMHFMAPTYPGESISLEGTKVNVESIQNAKRSPLGNLLALHPELLTEGLFGGSLSVRWPFIGSGSTVRMRSEGIKKWDGRSVLSIRYMPHSNGSNGELQIHLYLDPVTYQHVGTVYRLRTQNSAGDMRSNDEQRTEFLEERFSAFRKEGDLMLPHHWELRYSVDSSSATAFAWDTEFSSFQ